MNEVDEMQAIGIDIGGSGCRLAVVDTVTGEVEGDVVRLDHDLETSTQDILVALHEALDDLPSLPVGLGFPGRVNGSTVQTAPNLRSTWPGTDVAMALGRPSLVLLNDADAAAVAEQRLGAAVGEDGVVLMITVGTGLGSGVHHAGRLVPGFELGLLPHPSRGGVLETHASGRARVVETLDLPSWSGRFNEALSVMEQAIDADLIIVGGGLTEHWDVFSPLLNASAPLRKARFGANAGLIGAAIAAVGLNA